MGVQGGNDGSSSNSSSSSGEGRSGTFTEDRNPGGAGGVGWVWTMSLVDTRIEVPGEKAMQKCVTHPNLDSFEALEGSGQMT